jgi:acetyl esterase/lipase
MRSCLPGRCAASLLLLFLAAVSPGCTSLDLLNVGTPSRGYAETADVAYGPLPLQKLDVYRPDHPDPKHGVVLFVHGGHWQTGTKREYHFAGEALASRGFVAVVIDYRCYPASTFPGFVDDAALAVRWTHDHAARFGGDPGRLFLMGHSAGAHIVALLTLDPEYLARVGLDRSAIRGTAGLSGPYDFLPPPDDRPAFNMARDDVHPDPQIEPIHFVDGHAPPMLLVQGDQDQTVDPVNATRLAAAIRAAGGRVQVLRYPARAHVGVVLALAWPFRWLDPVLDDTAAFFKRQ